MRVPAIAMWQGTIGAGTATAEVASTLDVFPTVLALAGGVAPSAQALDGYDMTDILLARGSGTRGGRLVYYPQFARQDRGLYAVRAGRFKAHFHTQGSLQCGLNNTDSVCRPTAAFDTPSPPLVFDLGVDPGELYPVAPSSATYRQAMDSVTAVMRDHLARMAWYPYPMLNNGTFSPHLWPCAKPGCSPFPSCCTTAPRMLGYGVGTTSQLQMFA